jgi:hypothetical protein
MHLFIFRKSFYFLACLQIIFEQYAIIELNLNFMTFSSNIRTTSIGLILQVLVIKLKSYFS